MSTVPYRVCFIIVLVNLMVEFLVLDVCSKNQIFHESQNLKMKLMQDL